MQFHSSSLNKKRTKFKVSKPVSIPAFELTRRQVGFKIAKDEGDVKALILNGRLTADLTKGKG